MFACNCEIITDNWLCCHNSRSFLLMLPSVGAVGSSSDFHKWSLRRHTQLCYSLLSYNMFRPVLIIYGYKVSRHQANMAAPRRKDLARELSATHERHSAVHAR